MNDHQHAAVEQARIAWHDHQFEHECYGQDCAEDRRLYRAYQRAMSGDLAELGSQPGRPVPDEQPRPKPSGGDSQPRGHDDRPTTPQMP